MGLFDLPNIPNSKINDKNILNKTAKKVVKPMIKGGGSLLDKINSITYEVDSKLGEYKDKYECIRDLTSLTNYIDKCIENGECALDTETMGLNPMLDDIVGFSLYTPNNKAVYIPINHIDYVSNELMGNQLTKDECKRQLQRLVDNQIKFIMFNAKFDTRVLRHQIGIYITPYWDGYIAQRLLNENEPENGLKALHKKYVLKNEKDAFSFSELFENITFNLIPIKAGYIYAARDAEVTYELYKYQEQFLDKNNQKCIDKDLIDVAYVFREIEMPLITVVADMEDYGIKVDIDYMNELSEKYNKLLLEKEAEFYNICDKYIDKIEAYKRNNPNHKLGSMINIASATQIAILLYDILGEKPIPKQPPRGTGEEVLKAMDNEFCKAILEYREVAKLISTYIDKMGNVINPNDGKVHCSFNQYGADTGRFSSSDPNMQNIPSHNKDIRKMFVADDGYVLMSSDYSQQEPKVMTQMCGDEKMLNAYKQGKDLYAEIASLAFDKPYEDCLEFYLDDKGNKTGKTNKEGKARRTQAKSILLGILYGRGLASVAEQLKTTKEKAKQIQDKIFKGFPAIPKFEADSKNMALTKGYVTTLWGRKRRLPNMSLPKYEFDFTEKAERNFNPLDFEQSDEEYIDYEAMDRYTTLMDSAYGKVAKEKIKAQARQEGIIIKDNGGFIADAERQCVNARIQGSAADMSKKAMLLVGKDERLKELGFQLLIPVHDELIAQCPLKNAKECSERFAMLMSEAAKDKLEVPISCDVEITKAWYGESVELEDI